MNREFWLLTGSVVLTVAVALGMIRWLAPGLLGGPADMQLVQLDEMVPAYYDGIFRTEHIQSRDFQLKDPLTRIRNRPFMPRVGGLGPHDALGFRNAHVPAAADVVTIGDSMTYGNNVFLEEAWPAWTAAAIGRDAASIYNISTGGWGAVQYLYMFGKAMMFRPRVVVVAFYTGNDPLESFSMVYGNPHWHWLRPDESMTKADAPRVTYPAPVEERWGVDFGEGVRTVFTPTLRLASNSEHPAAQAGYEIMAATAEHIGALAADAGIKVLFTIIPTKELVYAPRVQQAGMAVPADYATLVGREAANIDRLAARMGAIQGARYIDVVTPLQQAALRNERLYIDSIDGHPDVDGYRVIGTAVAGQINGLLPAAPGGLYSLTSGNEQAVILVKDEGVWYFSTPEVAARNGWPTAELQVIHDRDLVNLPHRGVIAEVDPSRFGPGCCGSR